LFLGLLAFLGAPSKKATTIMVIIVSLPRTGSSLLAGMLHDNGISMGNRFNQADEANPTGYFEDRRLTLALKNDHNRKLTDYIRFRNDQEGGLWGMKNPELCGRLHQIDLDDPIVINTTRPEADIVSSLSSIYGNPRDMLDDYKPGLKKDLNAYDHLKVPFYNLVDNPVHTYQEVCDYIGIDPDLEVTKRVTDEHVNHRDNM